MAPSSDKEDSFHTPLAKESMLSASLRAGVFDTNVAILHTCSLPDLRSLFSTTPMPIPGEERTPDNQELNEEVSDQEEEEGGGSESDVVQEPASRLKGDSEGEESHGEDEVREEGDSEEEGWSSSDDEDIHQLVQTLQSYVEESSMSHFDRYYFDITMCTDTVSITTESLAHTHSAPQVASPGQRGISPPPPMEEWEESGSAL